MALYALSGEHGSFVDGGALAYDTTSGKFDGTYGIGAYGYVNSTSATSWIGTGSGLGAFTTFWHRGFFYQGGTLSTSRTIYEYRNSSGTAVFRLYTVLNSVLQPQYWNGSSWTSIGSGYDVSTNGIYVFDLKIVCGGSGSFEFYCGLLASGEPGLVSSGSASMTSVTNIDEIRHYSPRSTGPDFKTGEWIWGDETTQGHRYALAHPTGDGTDTAGSGDYTSVDNITADDATSTVLSSNGDAETYTHSAMTMPAGTVKAVQLEMRVRNAATGAQNVKGRLRIGGTDYNQASNYSGISTGYTRYCPRWTTNPAGGSWTNAAAKAPSIEFGSLAQT